MSYKVYKAYFKRREDPEEQYDLHVALFIRSGPQPENHEGELFHVIDDDTLTTDEVGYLTFNENRGVLEYHPGFKEVIHIGSIPENNMESLRTICRNMPPVITPHDVEKPDCVTWLDNLIHDLNESQIASFESSFEIPSHKKPLQAEGFSFPSHDNGSESSSKANYPSPDANNGSPLPNMSCKPSLSNK